MKDTFDNYFFTSNASSFTCPNFPWTCEPKTCACARDSNTGIQYSCDFAKPPCKTPPCFANVCWTGSTDCKTDGTTLRCGDGANSWCCLNKREICTQNLGQINMCWHSAHDTLTNISIKTLNSLYSSLSSSKPSASSYMFDPLALIAATATTSASTRSTSRYSVFAETTSTASNTSSVSTASHTVFVSTSSESSSLSGGAIAGIVIGILVAFAFLAGGFYMIARRRRQKNVVVQEAAYEADAKEVQELSGEERSELPAAKPPALELEGSFPEGPKIPGTDSEEMHALSHGRDE